MIKKTVWQDEKDFTLEVPVNLQNDRLYGEEKKSDIPDENLLIMTSKISKKVMISPAILWNGATKSFLLSNNGIKVNKENYLRKELFLAVKKVDHWIFAQDGTPSHRPHLVQYFLKQN